MHFGASLGNFTLLVVDKLPKFHLPVVSESSAKAQSHFYKCYRLSTGGLQ